MNLSFSISLIAVTVTVTVSVDVVSLSVIVVRLSSIESIPFPWMVQVVLPVACPSSPLRAQVPGGLALSPGELPAGLAWIRVHLEGLPRVCWALPLAGGVAGRGRDDEGRRGAGGGEVPLGGPCGGRGSWHHTVTDSLGSPLPPLLA